MTEVSNPNQSRNENETLNLLTNVMNVPNKHELLRTILTKVNVQAKISLVEIIGSEEAKAVKGSYSLK